MALLERDQVQLQLLNLLDNCMPYLEEVGASGCDLYRNDAIHTAGHVYSDDYLCTRPAVCVQVVIAIHTDGRVYRHFVYTDFDKVPRNRLISKLVLYGTDEAPVKWTRAFYCTGSIGK